jgi:hypothetical protein
MDLLLKLKDLNLILKDLYELGNPLSRIKLIQKEDDALIPYRVEYLS